MTTFYDDREVRVTAEFVQVDGHAYRLADIAQIWHVRGARSWRVLANRGALLVAIISPLVAAGLGLALAVRLDTSPTVTIAIVGGCVLLGLAVAPTADYLLEHVDRTYTRGARELEIWVRWRGAPVRLLRTDDALRFGRIYRALERAVERAPLTATRR